ncbi:MAG TPA: hypothetical protein VGA63_13005 [Geopsychrobacteraceae bacterium]|jgi:hypothetical protein
MKAENITAKPEPRNRVVVALAVIGLVAIPAAFFVAWPALVHLGEKLV